MVFTPQTCSNSTPKSRRTNTLYICRHIISSPVSGSRRESKSLQCSKPTTWKTLIFVGVRCSAHSSLCLNFPWVSQMLPKLPRCLSRGRLHDGEAAKPLLHHLCDESVVENILQNFRLKMAENSQWIISWNIVPVKVSTLIFPGSGGKYLDLKVFFSAW